MLSARQLRDLDVPRMVVRHKVRSDRWVQRSAHVWSTTTGDLSRRQWMWLAVLHAGNGSLVGGLSAAELAGLTSWHRDEVSVLVHDNWSFDPVPGVRFVRTRRPLDDLRARSPHGLPVCALEPAALLFAAREPSPRTAQGALAALVQQRLTTAQRLSEWLERLHPLRRSPLFRRLLVDLAGGAQSLAEADVRRMCRRHALPLPDRQRRRQDRDGRWRWTDCEWDLPAGRTLVLEVDGAFHLEVVSWGEDIRRRRRLTTPTRTLVRCTGLELRDDAGSVAEDLAALGVGASSA